MAPAKKDPAHVKSDWLKIRATPDRLQRWANAASEAQKHEADESLDFSAWVTRALNRAMAGEASDRQPGPEEQTARGSRRKGSGR